MIDRFCLKINNSIDIIDEQYQSLYSLAKIAVESTKRYKAINILLDAVKEKCEKSYVGQINPMNYRVLVKPTRWSGDKHSRF